MLKRGLFGKRQFNFPFLTVSLISVTIMTLIFSFSLVDMAREMPFSLIWQANLFMMQLSLIGIILTFLITIFILLHRGLGVMHRMEEILEKIIDGDYSLRLSLRKKDIMQSFANKLNKVLDLLEAKSKS